MPVTGRVRRWGAAEPAAWADAAAVGQEQGFLSVVEQVVAADAEQDLVAHGGEAAEGERDDVVGDAGAGGSAASGALAPVAGAVLQGSAFAA